MFQGYNTMKRRCLGRTEAVKNMVTLLPRKISRQNLTELQCAPIKEPQYTKTDKHLSNATLPFWADSARLLTMRSNVLARSTKKET